jgi:hypothetical protein
MSTNVDFSKIRGDTVESQRATFEQLVCHLARLDKRFTGEFRRIEGTGGDGGVEAIWILPHGTKVGYQAKYHTDRSRIDWVALDQSVKTALANHPQLERYVISLPCDFTGTRRARGGSTDGVWGKWNGRVRRWKEMAAARTMTVAFEAWTAFELDSRLHDTNAQHLLQYFFGRLVFSSQWIECHLYRTVHDLHARYSPDEHVDTESLKAFDVIFHRQNLRHDLQVVFDLALRSDPRAAVSLIDPNTIPDSDIRAAERAIKRLVDLNRALDWPMHQIWPLEAWSIEWYSTTRALLKIQHAADARLDRDKIDNSRLRDEVSDRTKAYTLARPEVFGGRWFHLLPIDGSRAVLFVGRAGAGKSHALARGVQTAFAEGIPVIHILGQHIVDNDPRTSILKRLELTDWSFHEVLSALNLAAEAADTRALIVIDALNEGRGLFVWRDHLASFIAEINRYDRIVLVASCREEYFRYVISSSLIANPEPYPDADRSWLRDVTPLGKFVRVNVEGFRTPSERESALHQFMDQKGIARPTAPVLDDEFFNPLFMSSVCRAMASARITAFPRGLRGAREIFGFVLQTKCVALGTRHDGTKQLYDRLRAALARLASCMAKRRADNVPIDDAVQILDDAFQVLLRGEQTWLEVFEGADILRTDDDPIEGQAIDWSMPNLVIRFAFQRLQDNLIAEALVGSCTDIEQAFNVDAPMEFLIDRTVDRETGHPVVKLRPEWIGTIGALWAAVAEKHGKELAHLKSFFGSADVRLYEDEFRSVFRLSVRERSGTAFNERTNQIFDSLWRNIQPEKLEILLSAACVPDHAWNANFLHAYLHGLTITDRDRVWSCHFEGSSNLRERADGIIDWALDVHAADHEVVRLAALTISWLLSVTNESIRDRSAKALANLCSGAPGLPSDLLSRFHNVDDADLLNRLLSLRS